MRDCREGNRVRCSRNDHLRSSQLLKPPWAMSHSALDKYIIDCVLSLDSGSRLKCVCSAARLNKSQQLRAWSRDCGGVASERVLRCLLFMPTSGGCTAAPLDDWANMLPTLQLFAVPCDFNGWQLPRAMPNHEESCEGKSKHKRSSVSLFIAVRGL